MQSDAAHWCLLILSLSKDTCSSCRWFDRLAMNGLEKTLQSSWKEGCCTEIQGPSFRVVLREQLDLDSVLFPSIQLFGDHKGLGYLSGGRRLGAEREPTAAVLFIPT